MRILRRPRAWAAVLLAGTLTASGVSAGLTGSEMSVADAPLERAAADPQPLELVVAPETPVLTDEDSEARFTVLLRNSGRSTAPEGSVELRLGERLTGDSALEPEHPEETVEGLRLDTEAADTDAANTDAANTDGHDAGGHDAGAGAQPSNPTDEGAGTARSRTVIATVSIDAVASGKEQSATVAVPLADIEALTASTHGVYPVYARYVPSDADGAGGVSAFSPLVWGGPGGTDAAVDVTAIVPLTLPASVQSMPSRAQLSDAVPRLNALVDFAVASQSVLAIDPRIVTAVRAYGTEAPRSATELLTRIESTTLPSFLLQFGDADPAAQAALGLGELLQPVGFEFVTRFGAWEEQAPEQNAVDRATGTEGEATADGVEGAGAGSKRVRATHASAQSSAVAVPDPESESKADPQQVPEQQPEEKPGDDGATPGPGDAPLPPTAEDLIDWPQGLAAAWPAAGQADSRTLSLLRAAGLDLTILDSANARLTGGPRATLGESSALVTDTELDAAVRLALTGGSDTERALGESQAAARLALAASAGIDGLILGVDRGGAAEADRPEELLAKLTGERWIRHTPLGSQREGTAQLLPAASGEDRVELLRTALENEATVLEARAMLADPEYLDSYQRMRLLTLFGTRNALPSAEFASVARQFAKRDRELHDGVKLVDTKRAQLVGGSTRIPIQLRNSLPFDAIVTLDVAPTSAALIVPERTFPNILLPEDSSERVLVPVKSRVSSGESAIVLAVTSVDGEYSASTGRLDVAISTTVETVAIVILGSAAALLFGFGAWRSVRRRQSLSPRE